MTKVIQLTAVLILILAIVFANPAVAQDPNLSQDRPNSSFAPEAANSPATAQYDQYEGQYTSGVVLPDTGGPPVLFISLVAVGIGVPLGGAALRQYFGR